MKVVNRFYDEDRLRNSVEAALDVVSKEEAKTWMNHPCTVALKNMLQADMVGILSMWLEGGYADQNSVDSTAQKEAKARGMAQAMDDTLETIQQIGYLEFNIDGEENFDHTNRT